MAPQQQTTSNTAATTGNRGFPDPSLTLIEFGDALGLLLATRTERLAEQRRVALKKVAYVRISGQSWGRMAYPEIWIQKNEDGLFVAQDAASGRIFHDPSKRIFEIAFLSPEIFECTIQCLKEGKPGPLLELVALSFCHRPGFSLEQNYLVAPEDYAAERHAITRDIWVPDPTLLPMPV